MKFLSALYHLMSPPPPPPPSISAFLSGYPLQRGRGRNLLSIFKKEKLSVAITPELIHAAIEQFQFTELLGGGWIFYHVLLSGRLLCIVSFIRWSSGSSELEKHVCAHLTCSPSNCDHSRCTWMLNSNTQL